MGTVNNLTSSGQKHLTYAIGTAAVPTQRSASRRKPLAGAYVALLLFLLIYFSRPEDWIPGLAVVPMAKIAGGLAFLALLFSLKQLRSSLPREVIYLTLLVGQLFLAAAISSVWRGGAVQSTLNFAKVLLIVAVMSVVVITPSRLRRLIFIQAASVAVVAAVAVWRGHLLLGRLEGIFGAYYSDPNDLALAVIISLPLCLALLFLSRGVLQKAVWEVAILVMLYAVFSTGSRGGFVALVVTAAVFLWEFAIRGRRRYLLALALFAGAILLQLSGSVLVGRLKGTLNAKDDAAAAYASGQARQQLFWRSIEVTKQHPLFGVGPGNFDQVSGLWHTTHNSFTLMSAEGGLPALVLYVLILACGFKNLRAAKRLAPKGTESRLLAGALFASLVGYAVGSFFLSVAYAFFPYILIGYTTAVLSIARRYAAQAHKFAPARQGTLEKQPYGQTTESGISSLSSEILSASRP
jgi:putative inorganic carbon (HCO3(-)) transporter